MKSTGRFLLLTAIAVLGLSATAQAAFPGQNGKIAYARGGTPDIWTIDPSGANRTALTSDGFFDSEPAWSPNGDKIAFFSTRTGNSEIFVMNADGSGLTNVSSSPNRTEELPAWSPDGSKIAFMANSPSGFFEIFVMNADGSGAAQLTSDSGFDAFPAWSPDGTKIAFTSNPGYPLGEANIVVMAPDGSGRTVLTTGSADDAQPDWSPDGSRIFFSRDPARFQNTHDLWVMNANGTGQTQITTGIARDASPAWSPDGTKIVFMRYTDATGADLYTMSPDGSALSVLTAEAESEDHPDWQPITENRPPSCSGVTSTPSTISSANGKLVVAALGGASDPDGDTVAITVTGVTQDEPTGGAPDAFLGPAANRATLRAERDGGGDGRVYRIAFTASDGRGGTCSGIAKVAVPRGSRTAVDSAPPSFDSLSG